MNSTSDDINLNWSVSQAIAKKAGPRLAVACAKLPNLKCGDLATTEGFLMPCKQILHCNSHYSSNDKDGKVRSDSLAFYKFVGSSMIFWFTNCNHRHLLNHGIDSY